MSRYDKASKHEAMVLYASGVPIVEIAKRLGCHFNTVDMWRAKDDPSNWEAFKATAEDERKKVSLDQIRSQASEIIKNQLEDSIDLRSVAKAALVDIARRINKGELVIDTKATGMIRDLERVLFGVQQQQASIFNIPTSHVKSEIDIKLDLSNVSSSDLKKIKSLSPEQRRELLKIA